MLNQIREDIRSVKERDPAARSHPGSYTLLSRPARFMDASDFSLFVAT